jgi:hypothetical protein
MFVQIADEMRADDGTEATFDAIFAGRNAANIALMWRLN